MGEMSRLYRRTPFLPKPLFTTSHNEGMSETDDMITSITIKHGDSSGEALGLSPSTATIEILDYRTPTLGATATVSLTNAAAQAIASMTGANADIIKPRFRGRVGAQSVEDVPTINRRRVTTLEAVSWSRQLSNAIQTASGHVGRNVAVFLQDLMAPGWGSFDSVSRADGIDSYGSIAKDQGEVTYNDAAAKFLNDYGLFSRQKRGGGIDLLTRSHMRTYALNNYKSLMPLSRSMALSPAEWNQGIEDTQRNYYLIWTKPDGTIGAGNYGDQNDPTRPVIEKDLSYIKISGNHLETFGQSLRASEWTGAYEVPSITVDLLHLLNSEYQALRIQAGQILSLQPGQIVTFSGDWFESLRGIYFVEGFSETISPDAWNITLNLIPFQNITGELSPVVRPRTWEMSTDRWEEADYSWESLA